MTLPKDRIEAVRRLKAKGLTQDAIGDALGMSRSAVAGIIDRHIRRPAQPKKRGRSNGHYFSINPGFNGAMSLACEWPLGDPGDEGFHFCGQKREPGRPYCPKHCKRAYRPRYVKEP